MSYLFVYVIKGYVYSPDFTYMSLLVLISPLIICVLLASYLYITTIYLSHMLNTPKRERETMRVYFLYQIRMKQKTQKNSNMCCIKKKGFN